MITDSSLEIYHYLNTPEEDIFIIVIYQNKSQI